jgi:hypothetical protein
MDVQPGLTDEVSRSGSNRELLRLNTSRPPTTLSNTLLTASAYHRIVHWALWRWVMGHSSMDPAFHELRPWNEGRVIGARGALKPQQVWGIRFWLDQHRRLGDRELFDFAIDSKLRGCDVVKVRIGDIVAGGRIPDRAVVVQQKTKRPVQFELVEPARKTLAWLERHGGTLNDFVFRPGTTTWAI